MHAIVLSMLRPFLGGFDELTGEARSVRKSLFNLQAAGQADIDVRLHDGKVARGHTLLPLAFLELVEVDINFAFGHGAAGEDLKVAGDVLSRITAFPLVGIVQLLFIHRIDNSFIELDFSGMAPTNVVEKPMAPVRAHQPRAYPRARAGNTYSADGVDLSRDACSINEPYPKM